jgi:preprotein translocase subunit SecF
MSRIKAIPFMRYRHQAALVSALLVVLSIGSLAFNGLSLGLDFTGGTQIEVGFQTPPDLEVIRNTLTGSGYPNHEVVNYGTDTDVMIRIQDAGELLDGEDANAASGEAAEAVVAVLEQEIGSVQLLSSGYVSSKVGDELKEQGGLGMLVALGMIMIYIALRFQFKFSVGAVVSLTHDAIITLGFFSLTGMTFDLTVLAAVLAVIGYSLNDTIVVADRIRENFRILRGLEPAEVIDVAITQTLARSIITSFTTLIVLIALYIFGGEVVRGFSVALMVGIFFGTTSSIYVAASILMYMHISKEDLMPPKRDEELDAIP